MIKRFSVDSESAVPIYQQLVDEIRIAIKKGDAPAGTQLPTVLQMAEAMGLARGTIKRAYDELELMGLVEKVQGRGTFVCYQKRTPESRKEQAMQAIDAMLDSIRGQRIEWIEDTRQRADVFGGIISRGLTAELLLLISCLYLEKKSCSGKGRRFGTADDRLLNSAERVVSEEFSYALQIKPSQVSAYIAEHLKETE